MFNAAVIGLGNIGFQFSLDPKRKETWSHVSAYEKCEKIKLVAAVEIDHSREQIFKNQHPTIPVYKSISDLFKTHQIDIVSICTPTKIHFSIFNEIIRHPIKAIFCEKPLASTIEEAKEILNTTKDKNIVLAVNHTRRWDSNYILAKNLIEEGRIGKIKAVNAFYPSQIYNIGTHLFDTIRMLIQKDPETVGGISFNLEDPDPSISGWVRFKNHIPCTVISTGKREDLIFEIDIIGNEGRIRILENGERIECYSFIESSRYSGYRELSPIRVEPTLKRDRFLEAIFDIIAVLEGKKQAVNCTEIDGYWSLCVSLAMYESAAREGIPIKVGN